MSMSLRKLQIAAENAHRMSHPPSSPIPSCPPSDDEVTDRIHKIEQELADLPPDSPLRSNFQAILKDYQTKGEADLLYQNGRPVADYVTNLDLKRGPLYVERCSISIMRDSEFL